MTDTEKAALERRIDELCQENERLRADQAHWELGNCPSCPNVADLQEAIEQNGKLRELCASLFRLANYQCLEKRTGCENCPMKNAEPPCDLAKDYIDMLNLGIDVTPWGVRPVGGDGE